MTIQFPFNLEINLNFLDWKKSLWCSNYPKIPSSARLLGTSTHLITETYRFSWPWLDFIQCGNEPKYLFFFLFFLCVLVTQLKVYMTLLLVMGVKREESKTWEIQKEKRRNKEIKKLTKTKKISKMRGHWHRQPIWSLGELDKKEEVTKVKGELKLKKQPKLKKWPKMKNWTKVKNHWRKCE